jgi:hypothetical protein
LPPGRRSAKFEFPLVSIGEIFASEHSKDHRSRVRLRLAAVCCVAMGLMVIVTLDKAPSAAAYPYSTVSLTVHGFGGGEGMGQYGALGYAFDEWTWQEIISHYYGGLSAGGTTTIGRLPSSNPEAADIRVDLTWNDGHFPIVTSPSAFSLGGRPVGGGEAAQIVQQSASTSAVFVGASCAGPWPGSPTFVTSDPVASPGSAEPFPDDGTLASKALRMCRGSGNEELRGDIEATQNSAGADRTVNVLPLDWYVADSAAAESPGGWGTLGPTNGAPQGRPWGFQQTEAQVVATRSYAASSPGGYGGYADICDTTACQAYPGTADENSVTDAAVLDTEAPNGSGGANGEVVLLPNGAVAQTSYSASTGGYSAPGTFRAVVDQGDSVCAYGVCNPYHQYQVSVPVSAVTSRFPQIGTLQSVDVTQRNGYGDFGGRVLEMSLVGSSGSLGLTGDQFASDFYPYGLDGYALSNWFEVASQPSGGVGGYWLSAADGGVFTFGDAHFYGSMGDVHLNAPVVGMAGTPNHAGYWLDAADGGVFTFGDAHFYGSMGDVHLNAPVVGMAATPDGGGYWLVASDGGVFTFNAPFLGSLPGIGSPGGAVAIVRTFTGDGYLVVTGDGRGVPFGDSPQFGDVASTIPGYGGHLVSGAMVP